MRFLNFRTILQIARQPENSAPLPCKQIKLQCSLIACLLLAFPPLLLAQTAPLSLIEINQINFGILTSENGKCTLKSNGSLTAKRGQSCIGTGTLGEFEIHGDSRATIIITAYDSPSVQGVIFSPIIVGNSVKRLNKKGVKSFRVRGSLTLSNAGSGTIGIPYILSINYE